MKPLACACSFRVLDGLLCRLVGRRVGAFEFHGHGEGFGR